MSLGAHVKLNSKIEPADFHAFNRHRESIGIIATGTRALGHDKKKFLLPALQHDVKVKDDVGINDHVYVFLGEKFSRGLFAWAIPLGDETYKVGLASKGKTLPRMRLLFKTLEGLGIHPQRVIKTYGGVVYTGGLVEKMVQDNMFLVGDAAGQTKPTTGGGLVYLSVAARLLSDAIIQGKPSSYERNVKAKLGPETRLQLALRRVLNSLTDQELDEIFRLVKETNGEELISRAESMDWQASLIASLIRKIGFRGLLKKPTLTLKLLSKLFLGYA